MCYRTALWSARAVTTHRPVPRSLRRRRVLLGGVGLVLAGCSAAAPPPSPGPSGEAAGPTVTFAERITSIEARFGGRLGVAALDTATGTTVGHRTDERFLMLSMVKVPITAAILRRSGTEPGLLDRRLHWTPHDLVPGASSATSSALALADGMTVAELCALLVVFAAPTDANNPTGRATIARITREVLHAFDLPSR